MEFYKIDHNDSFKLFSKLGSDDIGSKIMSKKTKVHTIYIKNINVGGANILKQDALSIGADLAVPRGTVICQKEKVDVILIANNRQIEILSKKELAQPFGLKEIALELKKYLNKKEFEKKVMGIINANNDSFFEGSRFKGNNAILEIENMIQDGAKIIDIGAVSSKPNSQPVSIDEEFSRIKQILDEIYKTKLYEKSIFSIDSYQPKIIEYALNCGFKIVNDITGIKNNKVAEITAKYNASSKVIETGFPSKSNSPVIMPLSSLIPSFVSIRTVKL
jgi:dihydropteroate synthase